MSFEEFLVTLLTSGVVAGAVSAVLSGRFQLRAERLARRDEHWVEARKALKELEVTYLRVRQGTESDDRILEVEAPFTEKVDTCSYKALTRAAERLMKVGRLFAAHDPDNGTEPFEAAVDNVRRVIRSRLSGLN